ncbi:MAG: ABC-type transport auxiliary lipoprotein family protein [Pseudomonadota bacterium]
MIGRTACTILLVLCLAGCSLLPGGNALEIYELRAPEGLPSTDRPIAREVIVELPGATGTLETDRILIRPDALQAQYLRGARWGEETPVMVQSLMLRSLQETGGLTFVGRRPLGSGGDIAIVSDILDFAAERSAGGGIIVRLRLEVRLIRERDASVAAGRTFVAEVPAIGDGNEDIVAAFDAAADDLFTEFTLWTMARLGRPL